MYQWIRAIHGVYLLEILKKVEVFDEKKCPGKIFTSMPYEGGGFDSGVSNYTISWKRKVMIQVQMSDTDILSGDPQRRMRERANSELKEAIEEEERPWSDLPTELVQLIIRNLCLVDCLHFGAVCRSWRAIRLLIQARAQSPWLLFSHKGRGRSRFFNPSNSKIYFLHIADVSIQTIFCFANYGWLLMLQGQRSLFFLHPLTKEKIQLPDLDANYYCNGICFSSPPTSTSTSTLRDDCFVFGIESLETTHVNISLYHLGDDTWTSHQLESQFPFLVSFNNPVFYDGHFYCLSQDGKLGVFNPREITWVVLENPKPVTDLTSPDEPDFAGRNFLMKSDGELLSIFISTSGLHVDVFSLDRFSMTWIQVENLEGRMLFVGVKTSIAAQTIDKRMENKIYFPIFSGAQSHDLVFYSMKDRRFHPNEGDFNDNAREQLFSTWIELSHCGERTC